jgi:hypothetical protein
MRPALCRELTELEQEARAAGRADLVHHVQGARYILESVCLAIDVEAGRVSLADAQRASLAARHGQDEDSGRRPQT